MDNLAPGTYLHSNGVTKALSLDRQWASVLGVQSPTAQVLATAVGWVYIALRKRRQLIAEIETAWQRGEEEAAALPFILPMSLMARVDYAIQVYGVAYLYKVRKRARMTELRWLDPTTVRADHNTVDERGPRYYVRDARVDERDAVLSIPRDDLIVVQLAGLHEWEPLTAATTATRTAAEIMRGVRDTADTVFDNNALPPLIVHVPIGTMPEEVGRIQRAFSGFFNRRRGTRERNVTATTPDVTITPLSVNPADMALTALADNVIDEILAAHDVPKSVAVSNAANYATAQLDAATFVRTLGGRLTEIAAVLNADADVRKTGVELHVYADRHPTQQRDEQMASTSFQRYVSGGMSAAAALWLVSGKLPAEFPAEVGEVFPPAPIAPVVAMPIEPEQEETAEVKSAGWVNDARAFRRWYAKRQGVDVMTFESAYLSRADRVIIADELLRLAVYP